MVFLINIFDKNCSFLVNYMYDEDDENIENDIIDYEYLLYDDIKPFTDEELKQLCISMNIDIKPITEEQIKSILLSLGYDI